MVIYLEAKDSLSSAITSNQPYLLFWFDSNGASNSKASRNFSPPHYRGWVKLEFVRNLFDSIWKFVIRLLRKGKKYSTNSMKISSKFIRFDSNYRLESNFSDAGFVRNSLDSIRKFMIRLIRNVENNSKIWDLLTWNYVKHFHYLARTKWIILMVNIYILQSLNKLTFYPIQVSSNFNISSSKIIHFLSSASSLIANSSSFCLNISSFWSTYMKQPNLKVLSNLSFPIYINHQAGVWLSLRFEC